MRWNRSARTTLAANIDDAAAAAADGAANGHALANDATADPTTRAQAATAARILDDRAHHLRADAAAVRDGVDPGELGYAAP
ncbi:hypothetical protein ACFYUY_34985 [Kitasatospora sp. NPDC004745]|uniref:hypothetical protein n=1 Tax=Kitasatospora sp. NPDC004745 TaxID=3364019 RepID=UPI0036A5FF6E